MCPFLESTEDGSESESEYEFLMGLRYWERLTACSAWGGLYLWGFLRRRRALGSVRSAAAGPALAT